MKIICTFIISVFSIVALGSDPANLPLRGQGEYKWLFLHIYEARLWSEGGEDLYSKPLLLELKYKRDFNGKDIAEQSVKELVSAGHPKKEMEEWRKKLVSIFPDVKEGDRILAKYEPKNGITFYLNTDKELGRLPDYDSSKKFLDIWLGEKTSAPELRKQLLGKSI